MNKQARSAQSILWASAILVVAIAEEKAFSLSVMVVLATISTIMSVSKFGRC